ncbi:MAG: glycosyltransferase family 4 protein [Candidatus Peribacteraceae bacterium]|nr:glycosyltransferase family 4 protein [Candidatus Peribacteraceae bacterium]
MKKRVVILSAFLSPFRSGAEACAEEVSLALSEEFDITIVTSRLRRSLPRRGTLGGRVPVIRVGIGCRYDKWLYPFFAAMAVRRLHPDIVHAIMESYAGAALVLTKWFTRSRCILTCQSTNTRFLLGLMHRAADSLTVISTPLLARAKKFRRTDAVLIPNGLHLHAIPQREKILGRILFAGRLQRVKGVDTLLRAVSALPAHVHLHIVGDGRSRQDLVLLAAELGISDRVHFLGYIPHPDLYEEFARAEIFCGLSRSEALGNVFLEAQAAGCAVVATRVGGIPDIVQDGKTGILVPPNDPDAAANALSTLLEDAAFRKKLAEAGRKHVQEYDWRLIAEKYGELYS